MNEKGFATIFGLCLILSIALFVKGIQESEGNHAYQTTDFQAEFDLQNAAESGIYISAKIVHENPNILPVCKDPYANDPRKKLHYAFDPVTINSSSGNIKVQVWGERVVIKPYDINYSKKTNGKYNTYPFVDADKKNNCLRACAFFSVAELNDEHTDGKLYRRAFAYFVESRIKEKSGDVLEEIPVSEAEKNVIHFMEAAPTGLNYMKINNPDRN